MAAHTGGCEASQSVEDDTEKYRKRKSREEAVGRNMKGPDCDCSKPWYHGSLLRLTVLRPGSTITQDRELARVFSHKPSLVVQDVDSDGRRRIRHSGRLQGFLYKIAEAVGEEDVYPHPYTTMEAGQEWLTRRELKVELIGVTEVNEDELLTPERRVAVRGVIVSDEGAILLMQAEEPASKRRVWFAPGGGVEGDEDHLTCLRRELKEETGLTQFDVGPLIWTRRHLFPWGERTIDQEEFYYLIRAERFDPVMIDNPSQVEASSFRGFRWWTVEEIAASSELFAPRLLAEHLRRLLDDGPPETPIDTGV